MPVPAVHSSGVDRPNRGQSFVWVGLEEDTIPRLVTQRSLGTLR